MVRRPLARVVAGLAGVGLGAGLLVTVPLPVATAGGRSGDHGTAFRTGAAFDRTDPKARVQPTSYTAYTLDPTAVLDALAGAPVVDGGPTGRATRGVGFAVPTPTGGIEHFRVVQTQVLQPALAAAHPEISTWAGRSLDHPGTTVAMDLTPLGFHASVLGPAGEGSAWYVDPAYDRRGTTTELSYDAAAVARTGPSFAEREGESLRAAADRTVARTAARRGGVVTQRIYRLALTSDPTYAAYFGSANVLAEKATLLARVNQVYNDDLAVWLQLVNGEDLLNLDTDAKATGADGPCGAHSCFDGASTSSAGSRTLGQLDACGVQTLGRNRTVIGQLIGASNYDVGHLVLGVDGGGLSDVGTVGADYKAGGCTGIKTPQGDLFAVDYLAHELGHEFGGTHDFDGLEDNCGGGQHSQQASVEPGSGSSVMAYAGICGADDLQAHSDPYFSQFSQRQLLAYIRSQQSGVDEVQTVSVRGFDQAGEQITLGYPGTAATRTITLGSTYTTAGIADAVRALTGRPVVVAQWGYDPLDHITPALKPPTAPDASGFQVIFADTYNPEKYAGYGDLSSLTITSTSPGVSGYVGETAQGGPAHNVGAAVLSANHAPVVHAPKTRTVPIRTPFRLVAHGKDRDGDHLTYSWEQNDRGDHRGTRLLDPDKVFGPLFRIFGTASDVTPRATLKTPSPGENYATGGEKVRYFPDLTQVLQRNTNARTGTCPGASTRSSGNAADDAAERRRHRHSKHDRLVDCFSEYLPTADYRGDFRARSPRMRFVVTARDGSPGGGGVDQARVTLRVASGAGPFLVTSQRARGQRYAAGALMPVTWAVNGTRPLAATVSVLLSVDGGRHWKVVQGRTANDGHTGIRLPRTATGRARVMVRARGNYFFAVNDRSFRITRGSAPLS